MTLETARKKIRAKYNAVDAQFTKHIKQHEHNMAFSSCSTCQNFWGQQEGLGAAIEAMGGKNPFR